MRASRIGVMVAAAALSACSGIRVPPTLDPGVARRAIDLTAPDRPLRAVFGWRILDGDARFSGEGAARVEAPYRARLDLFGPNGEGYLSAALVGTDLRLPGEPDRALPPPAMIWSVLGVIRPPDGAMLLGTREEAAELELVYGVADSRLRYTVQAGRLRLAEWRGGGRRMVVELRGGTGGLPEVSFYRDWAQNTELQTELETVEEVDPYPADIWTLGR
jgi:hypothetical protein